VHNEQDSTERSQWVWFGLTLAAMMVIAFVVTGLPSKPLARPPRLRNDDPFGGDAWH
jgi:hypothetical protein